MPDALQLQIALSELNLQLCGDNPVPVLPPQQRQLRLPQHPGRHSAISSSSAWPPFTHNRGQTPHHAGSLTGLHFAALALHSHKHLDVQEIMIRSRSVMAWSCWRDVASPVLRNGF